MKIHHLILPLLSLGVALMQSCSNDDLQVGQSTHTEGVIKVNLAIACVGNNAAAVSRAGESPLREAAEYQEKYIESVTVIIYDKPMNAATSAAPGTIKGYINLRNTELTSATKPSAVGYTYDSGSVRDGGTTYTLDSYYTVSDKDISFNLTPGTYYAVAVANMGAPTYGSVYDMRHAIYTGDLYKPRYFNIDTGNVYSVSANGEGAYGVKAYGRFAMAGVNEVRFTLAEGASVINVTPSDHSEPLLLQRLAARIDIAFGDQATTKKDEDGNDITNESGDPIYETINDWDSHNSQYYDVECLQSGNFRFPIYDSNTGLRISGAHFDLETIKIVNCASKSNLYEQATIDSNTYTLGNEGAWDGGYSTNFVQSVSDRTFSDMTLASPGVVSPQNVINGGLHIVNTSDTKFGVFATLGYVAENTFAAYNTSNAYTGVYLGGTSTFDSEHFESSGTGDDHTKLYGTFRLRHSFGAVDTSANLCYGVVRNTIYRIYIRFYSSGDELSVRWWYYDGNDNAGLQDHAYEDVKFNKFILEGDGPSAND